MKLDKKQISEFFEIIRTEQSLRDDFKKIIVDLMDLRENTFHPLAFINGNPQFGRNVYIGLFSEVNARGGTVIIGDNCDIASFVSINVADSHKFSIGISDHIERSTIVLENNVFVGSHCFIGGNTSIGHHSVIAAGTILINGGIIPPYSLVKGNPAIIKQGHYNRDENPT
jgi:acetyltransferase-like isoleucine patch superfamily enzyme